MGNESRSKPNPTKQPASPPLNGGENEGEGNRSADRRYRESAVRHVQSGRSEPAAEDARRAVEGDEAEELRRAEQEGKAGGEELLDEDDEGDLEDDDEELDRDRD